MAVIFNVDVHIERFPHYRSLGDLIDDKLNFDRHTKFVVSNVSKFIFILNKLRNYIDRKVLLIIYYTLLYRNLIYNITVWGCASASRFSRVNSLSSTVLYIGQ